GDLPGGAMLLLIGAWWVYAAVLAVVGLWFSLRSPSSLRATVLTILVAAGLGFSYVVALPLSVGAPAWYDLSRLMIFLTRLHAGLSPLLSLAWPLPYANAGHWHHGWELGMAGLGLACWVVGGAVLAAVLAYRFAELTGRRAVRQPESALPSPTPNPLVAPVR